MDFILSLFFILIIMIFSGVLRTLVNKSVNKRADESSKRDEEIPTFNDNTYVEEEIYEEQKPEPKREGVHDLVELFQEYSLKKKNEVYNKNSYIDKYASSFQNKDQTKIIKEKVKLKKKFDQEYVEQSQKMEVLNSLNNKVGQKDIAVSIKKEPSLDKIKKLSYLKQAIVLSEVLGRPKGLDI